MSFARTEFESVGMRRRRSVRYAAAALAALCLLGPILDYTHMLVVRHATCPEHGELIHVDEAGTSAGGHGDEVRPGSPTVALQSSQDAESHQHDHCVVVLCRKVQAPLGSVAGAVLAPPLAASLQSIDQDAVARSPIAIYLLAPKNSPPA